jgi:hypothetical protein
MLLRLAIASNVSISSTTSTILDYLKLIELPPTIPQLYCTFDLTIHVH